MKTLSLALTLILAAGSAYAIDLSAARAAGAVCEQPDGLLRAVKPDGGVNALVAEVNSRRKAEYARISQQNGQTPEVAGQLAAPQILAKPGAKACP